MAAQLAREREKDRRHKLVGKFGMMDIMTWGFTAAEGREEIAYAVSMHGLRDELLNSPHFDLQKADERFQAFLAFDSEAAQLYGLLKSHRREDKQWREIVGEDDSEAVSLAAAIYLRAQAYYVAVWPVEFAAYESYAGQFATPDKYAEFMEHMNARQYQLKTNKD